MAMRLHPKNCRCRRSHIKGSTSLPLTRFRGERTSAVEFSFDRTESNSHRTCLETWGHPRGSEGGALSNNGGPRLVSYHVNRIPQLTPSGNPPATLITQLFFVKGLHEA